MLNYNEQKVQGGTAALLHAGNFLQEKEELRFYNKLKRFTDLNELNTHKQKRLASFHLQAFSVLGARNRHYLPLDINKLYNLFYTKEDRIAQPGNCIQTVETHRYNLLQKFEVPNAVTLVKKAMELGWST